VAVLLTLLAMLLLSCAALIHAQFRIGWDYLLMVSGAVIVTVPAAILVRELHHRLKRR
jgi:uncharacterized membrane protein